MDLNSGPLDYETVALTTSPPPLPVIRKRSNLKVQDRGLASMQLFAVRTTEPNFASRGQAMERAQQKLSQKFKP